MQILQLFSQMLQMISPHYPILIIGLIFISVIVFLLILFWLFQAIKRSLMIIKWPKKGPPKGEENDLTEEAKLERLKKTKLYRLKKFFGFINETATDELSRSFEQMRMIIEEMVGGFEPLYKIPLYLVVGAEGSAKKSILNQIDLPNPFELDMLNPRIQEMKKHWWFFDQALMLKAPGSSVLAKDSMQNDTALWRHLLSLLERYRPNRPIDGVVLTIPCDELIGKGKLDLGLIQERARTLYTKLLQLQTSCGISVPVYVVVTKTDSISGFESFCREIPVKNLNEIFGWSSPYGTNQMYSSGWIDEAFHQMEARLQKLTLEIYTENASILEADGLYVFSTSFREIKDTLRIYLNELFKTSNLHDPMFFRGVYFTGDATIPEYEGLNDTAKIIKNIPRPHMNNTQKLRLYFLKELFSNKIFLETSLARPTYRSVRYSKNSLNATKTVLILIILAGTVDTLSLHYGLSDKKGSLLNSLRQIQTMVQDTDSLSKRSQTAFDEEKFQSQGKFLIEFINTYENTRFFSPLVPATWFSTPGEKIETVLAIAFDHIVLRSLSLDLKLKADKILQGTSLDSISGDFDSPGLSKTKPFVVFKTFIKDIEDFERIIGKYNEFTETKDRIHLEPVVNYLFGSTIPKVFFEHISGQTSDNLKWGEYLPIELVSFEPLVRYRFIEFVNFYINSIFGTDNYAVTKFAELSKSLEALGNRDSSATTSIEEIQNLELKANAVIAAIEHHDFKWLNKSKLEFETELDQLIGKITNSKLLGKPYADEFKTRASLSFLKFKESLPNLGLDIVGSVFAKEKGLLIASPSPSFQKLQKCLEGLSQEPFILKTETKKDINPPPPGKIIMWDLKALLQASNLITSYDQFIQNKLGDYPPQLHNVIQLIGMRALQINVMNLIVKSMVLDNPPKAPSTETPEDAIKPIVDNLKGALPHLTRIIPILNSQAVENNFVTLQSVIVNQYYNTLGILEGILQNDGLYKVKDGNFDWWHGEELVNAKAFNASDVVDLKNYLNVQAERIIFLAKEFSVPILTILKTPGIQVNQLSLPLLAKWTRILDQTAGYEKKKPDSTMLTLENYIAKDLTPITIKNCMEKLGPYESDNLSGDYFLAVKQVISKQIHDRCRIINMQLAIKEYSKIVDFFNKKLAGKFPFSVNFATIAEEASEKDVKALFDLFDEAGGNADAIISALPENEAVLSQARQFLKTLEDLKDVFAGFTGKSAPLKKPTYMLAIDFRTNKNKEVGGSNIVDWFFSVGGHTVAFRGKDNAISWSYGDPIMISFKWAGGGTLKPAYDPNQLGMAVEDRLAAFAISSKWALFRILRFFASTPGELETGSDTIPYTLRFTIPTVNVPSTTFVSDRNPVREGTPSETARVYVRVRVSATTKAGGKEISVPDFPTGGPVLSEETRALAVTTPTPLQTTGTTSQPTAGQ